MICSWAGCLLRRPGRSTHKVPCLIAVSLDEHSYPKYMRVTPVDGWDQFEVTRRVLDMIDVNAGGQDGRYGWLQPPFGDWLHSYPDHLGTPGRGRALLPDPPTPRSRTSRPRCKGRTIVGHRSATSRHISMNTAFSSTDDISESESWTDCSTPAR